MYRETAKSEKKPLFLVAMWFVFIYVLYILWGIIEILLEVQSPFFVKHIIFVLISTYFGWKIIIKYIVEHDYAAGKHEFTATRRLGRKEKLICTIKYKNIVAIYNEDEKDRINTHSIQKKLNITKAAQTGKLVHIIYTFDGQTRLLTMKGSRRLIKLINDYCADTEDKDI